MRRMLSMVLLGTAVIVWGMVGWAESAETDRVKEYNHEEEFHEGMKQFPKIWEELNLREEQRQRMAEHRRKYRMEMQRIKRQLREKREALRKVLSNYNIDKAKAKQLVTEIVDLHHQLLKKRIEEAIELRNILTPEQFEKFKQKVSQFRKRRMQHWRRRMGNRKPFEVQE